MGGASSIFLDNKFLNDSSLQVYYLLSSWSIWSLWEKYMKCLGKCGQDAALMIRKLTSLKIGWGSKAAYRLMMGDWFETERSHGILGTGNEVRSKPGLEVLQTCSTHVSRFYMLTGLTKLVLILQGGRMTWKSCAEINIFSIISLLQV